MQLLFQGCTRGIVLHASAIADFRRFVINVQKVRSNAQKRVTLPV